MLERFFNFIFPNFCEICGKNLDLEEVLVCKKCESNLPYIKAYCKKCGSPLSESITEAYEKEIFYCSYCISHRFYFDRVEVIFHYKEPVSSWINKIKFSKDYVLAYNLGRFIRKRVSFNLSDYEFIVPVPLSKERIRKRGFNQSLLIGWGMLGKKLNDQVIVRIKDTKPQTELNQKQRWENVKEAFRLKFQVKEKNILVIDDVMTTGATLNEIAKLLKKEKAKRVDVLVIARSGVS